ncbi:AAA family ATPase [Methylobacterium sp. WCS2018Hpa-22]|uniref:AAA family ATPase n=1 Tax=Methylobacterium sp. WCS2018Hpa-22 TaxID=3073633 RepID=UPI00288B1771|nr:AAA family ATPase [Methylobacterium sp. WCS2018Hpa-22]
MPRTPLRGAVAPSTRALYANAPLLNDSIADDLLVWSRGLVHGTPFLPAMREYFTDEDCIQWVRGLNVSAYWAHTGKIAGAAGEQVLCTQIEAAYLDAARLAGDPQNAIDCWWDEAAHRTLAYLIEFGRDEYLEPAREVAQTYARDANSGAPEHLLAYGLTLLDPAYLRVRRRGEPAYARQRAVDLARVALGLRETHAEAMHNDRPGGLARLPVAAPSAAELIETARADAVPPGHVVVIPRIGGSTTGQTAKDVTSQFRDVTGVPLPLYRFPTDRQALIEEHAAQAPHARRFFEGLVALQGPEEPLSIRPFVVIGAPGGGKTTAVDGFFRSLGVHVARYACDGSSDNAAAGTPRRWTSTEVNFPLRTIVEARHANPVCLWDEVSRAGGHRQGSGGTLRDSLTSFMEPENARRYRDPCIEADVDISHVIHACTANSTDGIANQVLDRLRVLHFPLPGPQHMPVLARRMALEIARAQGLPDDHGELDRSDLLALGENWPGGSLRGLRRLVEVAVRVKLTAPYETRQ